MIIRMPRCWNCKHLFKNNDLACSAFPYSIPDDIHWRKYIEPCAGNFHYIDQDRNPYDDSHHFTPSKDSL